MISDTVIHKKMNNKKTIISHPEAESLPISELLVTFYNNWDCILQSEQNSTKLLDSNICLHIMGECKVIVTVMSFKVCA